ncbi:hypothetical protein ACQPZJ_35785 [Actinoplanes sp. CA-054009]
MSNYTRWSDIRAELVARAGGEQAFEHRKRGLLAALAAHHIFKSRTASKAS